MGNSKFFPINVLIFSFLFGLGTLVALKSPVLSQQISYNFDELECERLATQAEKKYRLPENILLSIARVESGYRKIDGITRSWPWTLNAGGNSAYFQSKEDAVKALKIKLKARAKYIQKVDCF